jgi:hypothetical protein
MSESCSSLYPYFAQSRLTFANLDKRKWSPRPNSSLERTSARRSVSLFCISCAAGRSRSALNVGRRGNIMKTTVRIAGILLSAESIVVLWYFGEVLGLLRQPSALFHGPTLALASLLLPSGALITGAIAALWPPLTTPARAALIVAVACWVLGLWILARAIEFMLHSSPLMSEARPTWW